MIVQILFLAHLGMARHVNPRELPDYAQPIVRDAIAKSGRPIELSEYSGKEPSVYWRFAINDRSAHALEYHESRRADRVHYLLHMSYEISRLWSVSEHERTVVEHTPGSQFEDKRAPCPWDKSDGHSRDLFYTLLNSIPTWARIERELWHDIPEHRDRHERFLHWRRAVTDRAIKRMWDPDNEDMAYRAMMGMTVVTSEVLASLTGLQSVFFRKETPLKPIVSELSDRLDGVHEPGYRGDKRVIESWADYFGLQGRYEWQPWFEDEER